MSTIQYTPPARKRSIRLPHFVNRFAVALHTPDEPSTFHWVIAAMLEAAEARTLTPDLGEPAHDPQEFADLIRSMPSSFTREMTYTPHIPDETFQAFSALCRRSKLSTHQGAQLLISWHALHDPRALKYLVR